MSRVVLLFLALFLEFSTAVKSGGGEGLRDKHLIIEGESWYPFLYYDYYEDGTPAGTGYGGVMYDLLLYMQKARNFTFTMVSDADWEWGECHATDNCTGMIGMVNRKEVDLAIGKLNQEKCRHKTDNIVTILEGGQFE